MTAKQINKMFEINDGHVNRDAGTGGQEGQPPPLPFTRMGKGGQRCPFNLKDCLGEIANCQKC
jgi:hypothetical protein